MPPGGQQPKWPLPSSPKHSQIEYYEYAPPGAEGEATVLELDGGYGWVCTAAATFIAANTWGVGGALRIYLDHFRSSATYFGATSTVYAIVAGLCLSQIAFVAPLVTKCSGVLGTRRTLAIGVILQAAALVGTSFAVRLWQLALALGLILGWGSAFLFVGSVGIVPQWFTRRQGLANGIAASGSGLGALVWALVTPVMIRNLGMAWSLRTTAICTGAIDALCMLLMRDRNAELVPNHRALDPRLLRHCELWLLVALGVFSMFGYVTILIVLPKNALELGLTSSQSALAVALFHGATMLGRMLAGFVGDRFGHANVIALSSACCAFFCLFLWTNALTLRGLLMFVVCAGATASTFFANIVPLVTRVAGLADLPAALSWVWFGVGLPPVAAEVIALAMRSRTALHADDAALGHGANGDVYLTVQCYCGILFLAAVVCALLLRGRLIGRIEEEAVEELVMRVERARARRSGALWYAATNRQVAQERERMKERARNNHRRRIWSEIQHAKRVEKRAVEIAIGRILGPTRV